MKQYCVFLIIMLFSLELSAQKIKLLHTYYPGSGKIKTSYEVLKGRPGVRHGIFIQFDEKGTMRDSGAYLMNRKNGVWKEFNPEGGEKRITYYQNGRKISDKKVGIWRTTFENGQVIKGFDYDRNIALETQIRVPVRYPDLARTNEVEGTVKIQIQLNEHCEVESLTVVGKLGYGCDEEALKVVKKLIALTRTYAPENCMKINRLFSVHFKLTD